MSAGNAVGAADWCRLSPQLAQGPALRFVGYQESGLIAPRHPANLREVAGLVERFTLSHRALGRSLPTGRDSLSVVSCRGSGVRCRASSGQICLPGRPVRPRLDLLEPTIRQLLVTISPLTQPRSEAWPERTTALQLTFPDDTGRTIEVLTRMQLLPPITPVPAASPVSSYGRGNNISRQAAGPLQSQSAASLPAASM